MQIKQFTCRFMSFRTPRSFILISCPGEWWDGPSDAPTGYNFV